MWPCSSQRLCFCWAMLAALAASSIQSIAADSTEVFAVVSTKSSAAVTIPGIETSSILGASTVRANARTLATRPGEIQLPLPGGIQVTANVIPELSTGANTKSQDISGPPEGGMYGGNYMWVGEVKGSPGPGSTVALTTSGNATVFGMVRYIDTKTNQARRFMVQPAGNGLHTIVEVKETQEKRMFVVPQKTNSTTRSGDADEQDPPAVPEAPVSTSSGGRRLLQSTRARLDVLIVLTNSAVARAGTFDALANRARVSVAAANKALTDSGVNAFQNIVGIRQASSYSDAGKVGTRVLDDARAGNIPGVHQWREELGADQVSIYQDNCDSQGMRICGWGYVLGHRGGDAPWAYTTMCGSGSCMGWDGLTQAHELGHNLGCGHNREDGFSSEHGSWAFGWRRCSSPTFKTIMSSYCNTGLTEIAQFSRPEGRWNNVATGDAARGDCARTLRATVGSMAQFRPEKTGPPPPPVACSAGITTNSRCGADGSNRCCPQGQCCSRFGWCGTSSDHCSSCQTAFTVGGSCSAPPPPPVTGSVKWTVTLYGDADFRGASGTIGGTWQSNGGQLTWVLPELGGFNDMVSSVAVRLECSNYDCPRAIGEFQMAFWEHPNYLGARQVYFQAPPHARFCNGNVCNAYVAYVGANNNDKWSSFKAYQGGAAPSKTASKDGSQIVTMLTKSQLPSNVTLPTVAAKDSSSLIPQPVQLKS